MSRAARRRVAASAPATEAEGLFRGMGRSADQRHRLGVGVDRDRRRRGYVRRPASRQSAQGPDRFAGRVIAAAPDVILASWCGKKVVPDKISGGLAGMPFPPFATGGSSRSSRR